MALKELLGAPHFSVPSRHFLRNALPPLNRGLEYGEIIIVVGEFQRILKK